jgi:hypothetical protein
MRCASSLDNERNFWLILAGRANHCMEIKQVFQSISRTSLLGPFGQAVVVILGILGMCSLAVDAYKAGNSLNVNTVSGKAQIIGVAALATLAIQSLARAIYNVVWPEKRIPASVGIPAIAKHMPEASDELYIVGQNLRTVLSSRGLKKQIIDILQKKGPVIYIIGATYEGMKAINENCAVHFLDTLVDLKDIFRQAGSAKGRLIVRFSRDAISLSCLISDPQRKSGKMVLTSKWAGDEECDGRLHFVIENWEYPELFSKLAGRCWRMTQSDTLTLKQMCEIIRRDADICCNDSQNAALDFFIAYDRGATHASVSAP